MHDICIRFSVARSILFWENLCKNLKNIEIWHSLCFQPHSVHYQIMESSSNDRRLQLQYTCELQPETCSRETLSIPVPCTGGAFEITQSDGAFSVSSTASTLETDAIEVDLGRRNCRISTNGRSRLDETDGAAGLNRAPLAKVNERDCSQKGKWWISCFCI